jgi:hypothetical protein
MRLIEHALQINDHPGGLIALNVAEAERGVGSRMRFAADNSGTVTAFTFSKVLIQNALGFS